ncbi:phosphomevalonate kinase [Actinomyces viscosus]|uniref:phosphomevalonate kinase n=1 Tax=Actinomyces viscosus TaxID=1656 RepID=UPI0028F1566F|nr:phosphomevalonate kinase [Actinomyces viscosus]
MTSRANSVVHGAGHDVVRRAPGKLYIAGEYAVVEPGHRAVLVAVDRFITVRATVSSKPSSTAHSPTDGRAGTISSRFYATGSRPWGRRPQDGLAEAVAGDDDYVISAIRVVEALVAEAGGRQRSFDLDVSSELDEADGRKLGLGSSSAVTVATVRAVAGLYGLPVDDLGVYKLAMLASNAIQPIGSGGDIAASAVTGWVAYASPDRTWLREARRRAEATGSVSDLVEADWPGLSVRRLAAPSVRLQVGWTGTPASTPALVSGVQAGAHGADDAYAVFLRDSQDCLGSLTTAIETDDVARIMRRVERNRELLGQLSRISGRVIETPALTRLVEIAREYGAAAKSSGAGGGDCGIALCPPTTDLAALRGAWEAAGIRPLELSVHTHDSPTGTSPDAPAKVAS